MNPFDFVKSVNESKVDLMAADPDCEKEYVPFIVNRALSHSADALFYANAMNLLMALPKRMQYAYYLRGLRQKKRWGKWHKADAEILEKTQLLIKFYGFSRHKAAAAMKLHSDEDFAAIKHQLATRCGGKEET